MYVLYILYIRTICIPRILRTISYNLLCDLVYHSLSHSSIGSIIVCATSTNSLSSALSSYNTYLIKFITLASSSLSLSLKTSVIFRLLIRGIVLPSLFASICIKWLIMPKYSLLSQLQHYAKTVTFILLSSEVILLCSCCTKEGLVYITIMAPSSCQPSSYFECTFVNIQLFYNVCSVSDAKYTFYIYLYLYSSHSNSRNTQYYAALLALLYTL